MQISRNISSLKDLLTNEHGFNDTTVREGNFRVSGKAAVFARDRAPVLDVAASCHTAVGVHTGDHPRMAFPPVILQSLQTGVRIGDGEALPLHRNQRIQRVSPTIEGQK